MRKSFIIYAALEFLILVAVRLTEFTLPLVIHSKIMFLSILLNFIMASRIRLTFRNNPLAAKDLVPLAFLFTLLADFFACVVMKWLIFEYIFFCCMDLVYARHLGNRIRNFFFPLIFFGISLYALKKFLPVDAALSVGWLHIILICTNTAFAWNIFLKSDEKSRREKFLFVLGLSLFLCCDLSIVVRVIIELTGGSSPFLQALVWTVYIPGNALILFSYRERIFGRDQSSAAVPSSSDCTVTLKR